MRTGFKLHIWLLLFFVKQASVWGQVYLHTTVNLQNTNVGACMVNTCGGTYYDDGGPNGNYSPNVTISYRTFCPDIAGRCIRLTFASFQLEPPLGINCRDALIIRNGPTQNSPVIWQGCGNNLPPVITANNPSGCITVWFISDGSNQYSGWEAAISCVTCGAGANGGPSDNLNTDCQNATFVCDNLNSFSGNSQGPGLVSDACESGCMISENYSNWYMLNVTTAGTLGLVITPNPNTADYDFALYGPVTGGCANLGNPIRCSYAANSGPTGMNNTATDNSEDVSGDGWVSMVNVTTGIYYLLVNQWTYLNSSFTLDWTGTAVIGLPPPVISAATPICSNGTLQLSAGSVAGATYSWTGPNGWTSNLQNPTRTPPVAGTYTVRYTVNGCQSQQASININVLNPPTASITGNNTICSGQSTTLTASAGSAFLWSNGATTQAITVSPLTTTTYTVTITAANGCTNTASRTVTVNASPNASINASATSICIGQSVSLTASGGGTYSWSGGNGTNATIVVSPTTNTTYTVTVTQGGCTASASQSITVFSLPNASITPANATICEGQTLSLTASGGVGYQWSTGQSGESITVSPSISSSYKVTVTNANGCTAPATSFIQVNPRPSPSINVSSQIFCIGQTPVTLTAFGGNTYAWSTGQSTQVINVSPSSNTTYTVTVTDFNGCTASASRSIIVANPPVVSINPANATICQGQPVSLSVPNGYTYLWSNGQTASLITVVPASSTLYTVTVTDVNGCTATASRNVVVNPNPVAGMTPNLAIICEGQNATLTAFGGVSYNWSNGATTASITVSPPVFTNYIVTVTDANGCTATETGSVLVNANPSAVIFPSNPSTCAGQPIVLTASGGTFFNWSNGATTVDITISPVTTTAYSVTVTNSAGCTAVASTNVTIRGPDVSISAPPPLTCAQTTVTLTAGSTTPGVSYAWSGGGSGNTKIVSTPGVYTVTVTDPANGCTATASVTVIQDGTIPDVYINTPSVLTCTNATVTLTAGSTTPGVNYAWSGGGSGNTKIVSTPGVYTVTVTDPANGCTATASVTVIQNNAAPDVNISAPSPLTCAQTTVTLTAGSTTPGVSYAWSGGGSGNTKIVSTPGVYTVTVTDPANGCTATASVTVIQNNAAPDVNISAPSPLTCAQTTVTLTAGSTTPGVSYAWSGGGSGNTKIVSTPGVYTVTVTDPANGCTATASVTVIQNNAAPDVSISAPPPLTCAQTTVTLTAGSTTPGVSYAWSGGGNGNTKIVSTPGVYTVTVTDPANGCTATASVTVIQNNAAPDVSISAPPPLTCAQTTVTLTAGSTTPGVSYAWSGGGSGNTKIVSTPGVYTLTVTNPANGCTATASVTVIQNNAAPDVNISAPSPLTCAQTTVTLTAGSTTPGVSYAWSGGGSGNTKIVSTPGVYTVTVTDPANGCTATASVTVIQDGTIPDVYINTPSVLTCTNATVTLTAGSTTPGVSYAWSGGGSGNTKIVSTPGVYTVTVTNPANGCTATASVTVIQDGTIPDVYINTPSVLTCTNATVTLTAGSTTPGVSYAWSGGGSGNTKIVSTPGVYTVTVTDPANGCTATASVTVIQDGTIPDVYINTPSVLTCTNATVTLTAGSTTPGVSYAWSGGGSGNTKIVSTPGVYTVTVTDPANGCTATASVTVIQNNAAPDVNISAPSPLTCAQTTVTLTAGSTTPGVSYAWSGGGSGNTKIVSTPGVYTVTVTDPANGCTATASVTVIQNNAAPDVSISAPPPLTCAQTTVTLTAGSTTPGVSYAWSGGGSGNTKIVSTPGVYTVTVTDPANGCTATASVTVIQNNAAPDVNISAPSPLTCAQTTVTLTAGSTTPGVSYAWSGGGSGNTKIVSTPGVYTVTVTDPANGCTATASVTVIQNNATPDVSISAPPPLTCAQTTVTLTAGSTTPGVSYAWSGGGSGNTKIVSTPGVYTVTVTDPANGCTATASVTVIQNNAAPDVNISAPSPLTCAQTTVTLTAGSTTPGVSYAWSGGGSGNTKIVSTPGVYTVTVTNPANGCTATASVTVIQDGTIPDVYIHTPSVLTCTNATVTLTAGSTTPGVSYAWSGGGSGNTKVVSTPGVYTVTVTDPANGCTATASVTVIQDGTIPDVYINTPSVLTCTNATVALTAGSTTPGVSYAWSGGGSGNTKIVSTPGVYTVTVTDPANGCTATASVTVIQNNAAPDVNISAPSPLTCAQTTVTLTAGSTTPGVSYAWSGGGSGNTKIVSTPGVYTVTVTDPANGCTATASVTVIQDGTIPDVYINTPSVLTCTNATVTLTAGSTTPGVSYAWSGGGSGNTKIVSTPGVYTVTVTNPANGCTATASVTVIQDGTIPDVYIHTPSVLTCTNATVTLTAGSTTPGVSYAWSGGGSGNTKVVSTPGVYTVTVTDPANGCTATASVTVIQDGTIPDVYINTPSVLTCTNATVALTAGSTTPGVSYAWSGGGSGNTKIVSTPGVYTVTVTDPANGCTATASVTVIQNNAAPDVNISAPSPLTCAQTTVTLTAGSTTPGVSYAWSGGGSGNTKIVSTPGVYTVTVTDPANGCTATASVTVIQDGTIPDVYINTPSVLTCTNATVTLTAGSTTPGVSYAWSGGGSGNTKIVSTPGVYTVTVTNPANGCTATASVTVIQDGTIPDVYIHTPSVLTCTNATVTLTAGSTTPGVSYAWSGGGSGNTKVVSTPGVYTVTVTDPANGCTATASVTVIQDGTIPDVYINTPSVLTCTNATVALTAGSTTPGVSYAWSGGGSGNTKIVSTPGVYTVTVTDPANGCTATADITVNQYQDMTITFTKNDLMCHNVNTGNIDITVTGGTGLFTYLWHDGYTLEDRTQLSAGAYSVTVNDDVNCSVSANIIITQPDTLIVSETHTDIRCAGETTGEILITVTGGVAPYQYYWNDGVTIQNRSGLAYGFYTVTVQDDNFCTAILGVNLTEPPPIEVIHTHTDAGCNGASNGRIEITTGGGVPPYSYTWNDGATTEDRSNLAAGNYSVTVTDNNQCTVTVSEVISELSSFIVDIFPTPESCVGKQDGRVNVQHTGGTSPFSYSWSNGLTTRDIDNLSAGTYFLTITDANNCALIESAVVEALSSLTVNAVLKNATCPPMTDGEITLNVSGGNSPMTYIWNDGNTESKNENLAPGNYSVTITDGNGCSVSDSFSITYDYIFSIEAKALGADTIMKGESVTLNVLTNENLVNFEWQPASGLDCNTCASPLASPLATTNYVVNAISLNGCMASDSVRIVVIERENVFAPGGFSPNGDGINDEFALNGAIVDVEKFYIMVYDRWGEKLFESYDPDFRWSGIFKGKPLPPGVYVYHMKYKLKDTNTLFERKGSVTLIR